MKNLNEAEILSIKRLKAKGIKVAEIADRIEISEARVKQVLKGNITAVSIKDRVYKWKTKNKEGFIKAEINDLLKDYPKMDVEKFTNALTGITCIMKDNETVIYHCDIEKALHCGTEKRDLNPSEWD